MLKLAGEVLEGQLADHIARLNAHTKKAREVFRTGEYVLPFVLSCYSISQATMTANTIYAVPFLAARDMTVDRIAINVITADTGNSARMGIYRDGNNLYPGELLLDAGEVSVGTTGVKAITIDQSLMKGLYWLAIVSDGTPNVRVLTNAVTILGMNSTHANHQTGWSAAFTYAALPDPFTAGGSLELDHTKFCIGLRLATLD